MSRWQSFPRSWCTRASALLSIRGWLAMLMLLAPLSAAASPGAVAQWQLQDRPAPVLQLPDLQGQSVNLAALRGQVVLVNFWASWCEPCRDELPELDELRYRHADQGLVVLAVNLGEAPARVRAFLQGYVAPDTEVKFLLDRNSQAMRAWQVRALPASFLIDRQGRVRAQALGRLDIEAPQIGQLLGALLSGTVVAK